MLWSAGTGYHSINHIPLPASLPQVGGLYLSNYFEFVLRQWSYRSLFFRLSVVSLTCLWRTNSQIIQLPRSRLILWLILQVLQWWDSAFEKSFIFKDWFESIWFEGGVILVLVWNYCWYLWFNQPYNPVNASCGGPSKKRFLKCLLQSSEFLEILGAVLLPCWPYNNDIPCDFDWFTEVTW
jgi:hypothetical protein